MPTFKSMTAGLLSLLYPPLCVGCRRRVEHPQRPLCPACINALETARPERLTSILERLPTSDSGIDTCCALWVFEKGTPLQDLLHMLKYGNRPRFGVALGRMLGRHYLQRISNSPLQMADIILPIPLYRTRYLTRGYNQSGQLAAGISTALDVPLRRNLLVRQRSTRSQTNLTRNERWENVAGAFRITTTDPVIDRTVLLIDDVLTTGSTVSTAAQSLQVAGAASVHVATLAVARLYEKDRSSRV